VLEQQRGDTALVHAVGNGQGNLRRLKAGDELVTGDPDQLIAQQGEQRPVVRAGLAAHAAGFRSAATRLMLKKRKYRFSGDIASCSPLTAS